MLRKNWNQLFESKFKRFLFLGKKHRKLYKFLANLRFAYCRILSNILEKCYLQNMHRKCIQSRDNV